MNIKKIFICCVLIFVIASLSFVSANEIKNSSNFTELNQEIINANDTLEITNDYTYLSGEKKINIKKSINITGQKQIIDCKNEAKLFNIKKDNINVTFKNLTFKNVNPSLFKLKKGSSSNITLIDCKILKNNKNNKIVIKDAKPKKSISVKISPKIKKLTKSIVGKSKGITAAMKIAKWVNKKIKHEKRSGFYQTPKKTLKRKKGNCCCKSELFLQMCYSIGLGKNHKLRFVHVGSKEYKHRHFFTVIDHVCVDIDHHFKNPWGKGGFKKRDVYSITNYPTLPLERTYRR